MTTHIIYTTILTSLLWLFYRIVLEGETIHKFKRIYLLLIFPLSWLIPFISFSANQLAVADIVMLDKSIGIERGTKFLSKVATNETLNTNLLLILYALVGIILLTRFLNNLYLIASAGRNKPSLFINGLRLVILESNLSPYSFGKTFFVGKAHYENGIEREILVHEHAHIKEGHSLDIVLAELIIIFNWFNPIAWLLKKSIQLNHEFLADRAVVTATNDIGNYQSLLLHRSIQSTGQALSNQFNHPPLKKRIFMMLKHSPRWIIATKQLLLVPMLLILVAFFSNRTSAQSKPFVSNNFYPAAKENAPQDILEQYKAILDKYKLETGERQKTFFEKITPEDKKKLVELYAQMSKEQQSKQLVGFMKKPKPLPAFHPTAEQLENWKKSSVYGVWLNDKRIKNEELNKYNKNDFSYFNVSKLAKNARNYGKHYYQVTLMTKAHYEEYIKAEKAHENEPLMFLKWTGKPKK